LGQAFKKGDVPAGKAVIGSIPDLQVVGKNWWPDGSLKFAIISGKATLAAGTTQKITLGTRTPTAGTALTTNELRATGVTAQVDASPFGSASWNAADWSAPFMTWVSGPMMSSWIYRKPIGADAHLVAWLEVRLYKGGQVEVLPWVENGYLRVPAPTNKNANYAFTLKGTQRFSAPIDVRNHCRTVLISGAALSYWIGTDPQIKVKHDTAYLQSTSLVPAYRAKLSATSAVLTKLPQTYTPFQLGGFPLSMGSAGYDGSIGLLPSWDVAYLASDDPRTYAGVITNGYSAGRYGIHFRDETTQRPIRFSSYPNLVVEGDSAGIRSAGASSRGQYTPTATGGGIAVWASSHHPSVGYMAYLVTGRFYFMEEVQFAATIHYLKNNDTTREFSNGVLVTNAGANSVRGAAWAIRTLAQAACATPDGDPLKAELHASLEANVKYYHRKYVELAANPFGLVAPYANYSPEPTRYAGSTWQQDFFTASWGYALAMEPALPSGLTKMRAFFAWKARSIIGRLGRAGVAAEWSYRDAAPYFMPFSPLPKPDWTNPASYYSSWGKMYEVHMGAANVDPPGDLRGGYFPAATGYWGNLQPAIAYAVEHNVPGALEAYKRMTGAANWGSLVSNLSVSPVWAVKPRNAS
jgi:hypothetical protein